MKFYDVIKNKRNTELQQVNEKERKPSVLKNIAKGSGIGILSGITIPHLTGYGMYAIHSKLKNELPTSFKQYNQLSKVGGGLLSSHIPAKRIGVGLGAVSGLGYGLYKKNKYNKNKNIDTLNKNTKLN